MPRAKRKVVTPLVSPSKSRKSQSRTVLEDITTKEINQQRPASPTPVKPKRKYVRKKPILIPKQVIDSVLSDQAPLITSSSSTTAVTTTSLSTRDLASLKADKKEARNKEKKQLQELSVDKFKLLIAELKAKESFDALPMGSWQRGSPNIPDDIKTDDPYALFSLFFPEDIWSIIARNTNAYAVLNDANSKEFKHRPWHATNAWEIKVFIGCLIYMDIHPAPNLSCYWNPDVTKKAIHTIPLYISQNRFKQLRRWFHVSNPHQESDRRFEPGPEEDLDNLSTTRIRGIWWFKLEPLISTFRTSCKQY